jgi:hypothetical protein
MRCLGATACSGLLALLLTSDPAHATDSPKPFFVSIHVATTNPADSDQRVADFLDTANQHFAAAGIAFVEHRRTMLPSSFAVLETQGERHKLRKYFAPNTINVFLLDEIDDPTPSDATKKAAAWQDLKLSGLLAGAHIKHEGLLPGTYIILSRNSEKLTLTHELGHLFGAGHAKDPANLMSYGRDKLRFDDKQLQCFRATATRLRRQHVLRW